MQLSRPRLEAPSLDLQFKAKPCFINAKDIGSQTKAIKM